MVGVYFKTLKIVSPDFCLGINIGFNTLYA